MFELKQVSQLATVLMGQSPPSSSCTENGQGLPFIQGNAEFGSRNPIPLLRCSTPTRIAEKGDFLLSVRAPVGELNQSVQRMVIGRGLSAIRFPEIDQPFAWHSLKSAVGGLNRVAQGSTFVAVSRQDVENLEIHWFAVPEYRNNVAYVLDIIDEAIAKTEAVIAKMKQVRTGLLHDLLSYGLNENGHLRDPIAHPEQFKDSPLGRIPREWAVNEVSQLGEIVTGRTPPSSEPAAWGKDISFITPAEVTDDGNVLTAERSISLHGRRFTRELPAFSVLVVCIGSTLGKVAMTPGPCTTNQQINAIVCSPDYESAFVAAMVTHHIRQLHRWAGLQAVPIVNKSQFSRMQIPVAPQSEQKQIATLLKVMTQNIESVVFEHGKFIDLKSGLMSDLLTGQVRVPETITGGAEGL